MAKVLICKNPFRPQLDREAVAVRAGTRIDTMLRARSLVAGRGRAMRRNQPFVVQVNGEYLLQEQWAKRITNEDVITVVLLPLGGGGSNPLQMVLQVALIVAAVYTGGIAGGGAIGALASAGVMIAGGLVMSALFPPPKPNALQANEQVSPTYTLSAQGNTARLMEAIPVLYGRYRIYPDYAAQPYTEISNNESLLFQLFCLGQGEMDTEKIMIEDIPITNFAEVEYQIIPPGQHVTLFPDNVVTSAAVQGLELKGVNEDGYAAVGPFVANPAGTKTNRIGIDIVLPQGLFYANDEGGLDKVTVGWRIQARQIDDSGSAIGGWTTLGEETFAAATNTPQMKSYRYTVAEGRYEVRANRTTSKYTDGRYGNLIQWAGLRAYLPSQRDYGNVTMLAVAMRATNNLNQSTQRRINVIATRKLRTWNPVDGWSASAVATRNPAWAFADVLANSTYGKGMRDSRINLSEIYRLAQVWQQRGDTFDGVFDTTVTLWAALSRIARVGRAIPMYYAGVVDIVRNEPRTLPAGMLTPGNIVEDTFGIEYKFVEHDSPDHIIVEIINEDTWQPDEVKCVLPGGTELRPYRTQFPGIANRAQAWREGMSMAAANRDQRRIVTCSTELEGNIYSYLDLVPVSHDIPKWGLSGFIVDYNEQEKVIRTSEALQWWPGENHYMALRARDGSAQGPFRVVAGDDAYSAKFVSSVPAYVSLGDDEVPTHYQFGPGERRALLAQVRDVTPDENGKVTLTLVNYAESVHTAELGGSVPPPAPPSLLPVTPNAPVVDEVTVYATAITGEQMVSCTPARGALYYEFEASSDQGATWTPLGSNTSPSLRIRLPAGPWWVRARGVGAMPGPWKTWQGFISATMLPPPELTTFIAEGETFGIKLTWAWPSAIALKYIEIYESETPNFNNATILGQFAYPHTTHTKLGMSAGKVMYFWARLRDEANQPGPWFGGESGIQAQSSADADEILSYLGGKIGEEELAQDLVERLDGFDEDILQNAQAIIDEAQARANAIQAEAQARIDGLQAEAQARADDLTAEAQARGAAITQEKTERQTADDSLSNRIDTNTAAIGDNAAAIQDEETARVNAVSAEANARETLATQMRGNYTGSDLAQVTTGLLAAEKAVRSTQYEGLARQMTLLSAGVGEQFDYAKMWYFTGGLDGWTRAELVDGSWVRVISSSSYMLSPSSLAVNGAEYTQARLRVRKVGNPNWATFIGFYAPGNTGSNYTRFDIPEPAWNADQIGMCVLDHTFQDEINQIIIGGQGSATETDYFLFDWISVGRPAPGASSAALANEAQTRAAADIAEAIQRETLSVKLTGLADPSDADLSDLTSGLLYQERQLRATQGQALAQDLTNLAATVQGKADASALQSLDTRVTDAEGQLTAQSQAITELDSELDDKADAAAVSGLTTRVEDVEGDVTAVAQQITGLDAKYQGELYGPHAGDTDWTAGSTTVYAGTRTVMSVAASDTQALTRRVETQLSQIDDSVAQVEQAAETIVDIDNGLKATWSVKAQIATGGQVYMAGMALGAYEVPGQPVQTSIYFTAGRLGLLNVDNGQITTPFVVQGGQTFISQALIGTAWIKSANIESLDAYKIESTNLAAKLAQLNTAYVGYANIENLAVRTAHIQDLAVDTLKIGNNAVTISAAASGTGSASVTINIGYAASVVLIATVNGGTGRRSTQVLMNSSVVGTVNDPVFEDDSGFYQTGGTQAFRTTTSAANRTFKIEQTPVGSAPNTVVTLLVLVTMK